MRIEVFEKNKRVRVIIGGHQIRYFALSYLEAENLVFHMKEAIYGEKLVPQPTFTIQGNEYTFDPRSSKELLTQLWHWYEKWYIALLN